MTFTSRDLTDQITRYVKSSDSPDDFDIPGIVEDIIGRHGAVDIDTLDDDEFTAIVEAHDLSDAPTGFTAWLTTQADLTLNGKRCEVSVVADETGGSEPVPPVQLAVTAGIGSDHEAAQDAAEQALTEADWETVGDWEQVAHGYSVRARRA